ncbi:MAG: hypothetical protein GX808_04780 [Syntrophomonadaceae bacterium]|jgi:hypothetical protein|nr:hypothetical protein [Syntrophomonadaceae bacterium]
MVKKKYIFGLVMIISAVFFLVGCGSKTVNESKIKSDLSGTDIISYTDESGNPQQLTITELTIDKRQTYKDKKEDIIYCTVHMENPYVKNTAEVILKYNYYDKGGWIIEKYEITNNFNPITPPSEIIIEKQKQRLMEKYPALEFKSVNMDASTAQVIYEVSDTNDIYDLTGQVVSEYVFNETSGKWSFLQNTENINHDYSKMLGTYVSESSENYSSDLYVTFESFTQDGFYITAYAISDVAEPVRQDICKNTFFSFNFEWENKRYIAYSPDLKTFFCEYSVWYHDYNWYTYEIHTLYIKDHIYIDDRLGHSSGLGTPITLIKQ